MAFQVTTCRGGGILWRPYYGSHNLLFCCTEMHTGTCFLYFPHMLSTKCSVVRGREYNNSSRPLYGKFIRFNTAVFCYPANRASHRREGSRELLRRRKNVRWRLQLRFESCSAVLQRRTVQSNGSRIVVCNRRITVTWGCCYASNASALRRQVARRRLDAVTRRWKISSLSSGLSPQPPQQLSVLSLCAVYKSELRPLRTASATFSPRAVYRSRNSAVCK